MVQDFKDAVSYVSLSSVRQSFTRGTSDILSLDDTNSKRSVSSSWDKKMIPKKKRLDLSESTLPDGIICKGCGRKHMGECRLKTHPNFNVTPKSWGESFVGKEFKKHKFNFLPITHALRRQPDKSCKLEKLAATKCKCDLCDFSLSHNNDSDLLHGSIIFNVVYRNIKALLDTGSLQRDYMSINLASELGYIPIQFRLIVFVQHSLIRVV